MHDHIWGAVALISPARTHIFRSFSIMALTSTPHFSPKKINSRSLKLCMVCTHIQQQNRELEEDEE